MLTNILPNTHAGAGSSDQKAHFVLGQKMAVETCLIDLVQL